MHVSLPNKKTLLQWSAAGLWTAEPCSMHELRQSALTGVPHASTYNDDVETIVFRRPLSDERQERIRVRACMHTRFTCATLAC